MEVSSPLAEFTAELLTAMKSSKALGVVSTHTKLLPNSAKINLTFPKGATTLG
jgi:hypothetical protein